MQTFTFYMVFIYPDGLFLFFLQLTFFSIHVLTPTYKSAVYYVSFYIPTPGGSAATSGARKEARQLRLQSGYRPG